MAKPFSAEEDRFLRNHYNTVPAKRMSKMLGRSESASRQRMQRLGLRPSAEAIAKFKKDSQLKPGNIPWSKGLKGLRIPGSEKGWFKKGQVSRNTKSDGVITIRHHKRSGRSYKYIRIAKNKWMLLHQYNWIEKNGPIPEGHILVFKDGDNMNCEPENMRLITQAQHMDESRNKDSFIAKTMSGIQGKGWIARGKYDKDLQQEILKHPELLAAKRAQLKLNREINKHEKQD